MSVKKVFKSTDEMASGIKKIDDILAGAKYIDSMAAAGRSADEIDNAIAILKKRSDDLFASFTQNASAKKSLSERLMGLIDTEFDEFIDAIPTGKFNELFDLSSDVGRRAAGLAPKTTLETAADIAAASAKKAGDAASSAGSATKKAAKEVAGFCKEHPVMCVAPIAAWAVNEYIIQEFKDKEEEVKNCTFACLPKNYDEVKYGDLTVDDYDYRTIEELQVLYDNTSISEKNQPVCKKPLKDKCAEYCTKTCESKYSTTLENLAGAAGKGAGSAAKAAGGAASEGMEAFFDGIFGEGMGIPGAIGIVIFIIIIMVLVTTL